MGVRTPYSMEMRDNVAFGTFAVDLDHHGADSLDLSGSVLHAHGIAQVSKLCVLPATVPTLFTVQVAVWLCPPAV